MVSKWGKLPLYKHYLLSDPYNATLSDVKYYRRSADVPQDYSNIHEAINAAAGQTINVASSHYSLVSNCVIQRDVNLLFFPGSSLSLNGYKIETSGGSLISFSDNFDVDGVIVKDGSTVKAIYPSIKSAIDNFGLFFLGLTTETVELPGNTSLSLMEDISIPSGMTILIKAGSTLFLNGYSIKTNGGALQVENGANIIGAACYVKTDNVMFGYFSTIQKGLNDLTTGQILCITSALHSNVNNITIPVGTTLQVNSGSTIYFNNGAGITIYGKIEANGSTFTSASESTWMGIKLINADNSSRIENSSILNFGPAYGADGIYIEGCDPRIANNTISGSYNGIKIYNASPTIESNNIRNCSNGNGITIENYSNPIIIGNQISDVYYHGISAYNNWQYGNLNSEIYIANNIISNTNMSNYSGIRAYNSYLLAIKNKISSFEFGVYSEANSVLDFGTEYSLNYFINGNNEITNCPFGLVSYNFGLIIASYCEKIGEAYGAYNRILYGTYGLYASNNSQIEGVYNYWGSGIYAPSHYSDLNSYVTWEPTWEPPYPTQGLEGNNLSINKKLFMENREKNEEISLIRQAELMIKNKKFDEAKASLVTIIDKGSMVALNHLAQLFYKSKKIEILTYLEEKSSKYTFKQKVNPYKIVLLKLYHGIGRYDKVIKLAEELILEGYKEARIDLFLTYALDYGDNKKALTILNEIEVELGKNRSDELYSLLLPAEHNIKNDEPQKYKTWSLREEARPTEYVLYQNYPNPFNPITTIRYSIPYTCNVELKVFDTLGREVEYLVRENKEPGNYQITFDASKITSGMYFYSFKAGDYISTKKLLVIK